MFGGLLFEQVQQQLGAYYSIGSIVAFPEPETEAGMWGFLGVFFLT